MCFECYFVTGAVGAFLGLLAVLTTKTGKPIAVAIDIGTGVAGAVFVAWFLAPLAANQASRSVSAAEIAGALLGALALLALSKVVRPKGWWC